MGYNLNSGYGMAMAHATRPMTTGKVFYVFSSSATNLSQMQDLFTFDPDGVQRTFTSITTALANCVANRGDVIMVGPGYTETVTAAAGLTITVAGVTIIGIGKGSLRPTVSFTTAVAASCDITAANTTIQNMVFSCGINAQTAMVNVTGADVSFLDCDFITATATGTSTILGILTAATATRLKVIGCRFTGTAAQTTATTACIQHESGVDYTIQNCYFVGKQTQSILNVATVLRGLIDNNRFVVGTGTVAITMAAASTPFISNNRINVASGTTPITAAAGFMSGNNYSAAAGVTAGTASTF